MERNIYDAPESDLVDSSEANDQLFYVVSKSKFAIMFFSTLGFYSVYWFYRNWALYKEHYNKDIWPIPRTIFIIFFIQSLFKYINEKLEETNSEFKWNHQTLAGFYIIFSVTGHICDRLAAKNFGSPYTDFVSVALLPIIFYFADFFKSNRISNACLGVKSSGSIAPSISRTGCGALGNRSFC